MNNWISKHTDLPEDLSSVPNTHSRVACSVIKSICYSSIQLESRTQNPHQAAQTCTCTAVSRNLMSSLASESTCTHTHAYMAHTWHTHGTHMVGRTGEENIIWDEGWQWNNRGNPFKGQRVKPAGKPCWSQAGWWIFLLNISQGSQPANHRSADYRQGKLGAAQLSRPEMKTTQLKSIMSILNSNWTEKFKNGYFWKHFLGDFARKHFRKL